MRLLLVLLCLPFQATAAPILYDITFDSQPNEFSSIAPDGTGSFVWDPETRRMSTFTWDFEGSVGGIDDAFFGDADATWFFEFITGEDIDQAIDCSIVATGGGCRLSLGSRDVYGWPFLDGGYFPDLVGVAWGSTYFIAGLEMFGFGGTYSVTPASVPEPATLLLFSSALAGLALKRRRRSISPR